MHAYNILCSKFIKCCEQYNVIPQLAVWAISGRDASVATFQEQLRTLSCPHGGTNHQSHMIPASVNGLAGVVNGIEIPFVVL